MSKSQKIDTTKSTPCDTCGTVIPDIWKECPHCGRPSRFPNVLAVSHQEEKAALDEAYRTSRELASRAGGLSELDEFGQACSRSKAVFNCEFKKLLPIVTENVQIFADFYSLASLRCTPARPGRDWEILRLSAEAALIGGNPSGIKIHYAALTINGDGLTAYGECTITFREDMTAHRATVFPYNSALFFEATPGPPAPGTRAGWADRHKICVVKHQSDVKPATKPEEFPKILLRASTDGLSDRLVEVHIVGPITFRTFEKVRIPNPQNWKKKTCRCFVQ